MKIAFIGLGNMGAPIASHLSQAGHNLTIFNRSQAKAENWLKQHPSQEIAFNAKDACKDCDVLILCVGNDQDVEQLILGPQGAHLSLNKGALIMDHSTTSHQLAIRMHKQLNDLQIDYVDAPVSGGEQGAIDGTLTIMCGGDNYPVQRAEKISQAYSKSFNHMGEIGSGQLTKMVNQICVAGLIQGLSEGMHFGQQAGLDMDKVMTTLGSGAAASWQMNHRHETMNKGEYDFGFAVDLMRKDLGICLNSARENGASLPITAIVDQFYGELQKQGHGKLDTSSLLLRLNQEQ